MKKIMFNDTYGLTKAVLDGRKTHTRRLTSVESSDPRFHYNEIVAIAQAYKDVKDNVALTDSLLRCPGFTNKMFVKSELMPYSIRIINIKTERLQKISNEECFKEGITEHEWKYGYHKLTKSNDYIFCPFDTPREAFASLIDKTCGKGTWNKNPYVNAYEFLLRRNIN